MTRTILLSSFVLALISAQGAFAAATADDHHTISLDSIKIKTVNHLHPDAVPPKKGRGDAAVCNGNYPC